MRTIGPKSFVVAAPSITAGNLEGTSASNAITVNDSPRSSQTWNIASVYFDFPAKGRGAIGEAERSVELKTTISMKFGGLIVAKQVFKQKNSGEEVEEIPVVGNLEAFQSTTVYPGQSVQLEYRVNCETTKALLESGQGLFIVTYNLTIK